MTLILRVWRKIDRRQRHAVRIAERRAVAALLAEMKDAGFIRHGWTA